jgi:hypothetical protein
LIAVVASELDEAARGLVDAWSTADAVLISARDLCTRGWVFNPIFDGDCTFVANGARRSAAHLRGVVVRRPAVAAEELRWIADDDRLYVAAEINAFLVAWLSTLCCPVLNRPTGTSLCGPTRSQTSWQLAAARAGVAWSKRDAGTLDEMVYCGGLCYGASGVRRQQVAAKLANASDVQLLGLQFDGDAVAAVTVQPRLVDPGARNIVLAYLRKTMP